PSGPMFLPPSVKGILAGRGQRYPDILPRAAHALSGQRWHHVPELLTEHVGLHWLVSVLLRPRTIGTIELFHAGMDSGPAKTPISYEGAHWRGQVFQQANVLERPRRLLEVTALA